MADLTISATAPHGQILQAPPKTGFLILIPVSWAVAA
jgi:hypothetical protein